MLSDTTITKQVQKWVNDFIVDLNVCPFAKHEIIKNAVKVIVVRPKKVESALTTLMQEVDWLDQHPETETTLIVFPTLFNRFDRYLDYIDLAEDLMTDQGCEGIYQIATFHPDYCFSGVEQNDVSNYTNRSPYPIVHLLRESSIEKAIQFYEKNNMSTEDIPTKNIALMVSLGEEKIQAILTSAMQIHD
ncbi:DUF1415 domain-containing protein [Marinomonas agarivorans]|nr:DUF1415 domain-containing protein [Marinomonas agarivorans]